MSGLCEPQTFFTHNARQVVSDFQIKLLELRRTALELNDPVSKERRAECIQLHPVYRGQLMVFAKYFGLEGIDSSTIELQKTATKTVLTTNRVGAHALNVLASGFYLTLDDDRSDRMVPVKLSRKTRVEDPLCVTSIEEFTLGVVSNWYRHHIRAPLFSEILPELGWSGPATIADVQVPLRHVPFFRDLMSVVLLSTEITEHNDMVLQFKKRYQRPSKLVLKQRYYFNRGDWRAFYTDTDVVRSFTGAIIHALLQPKGELRKSLANAHVIPAKGKNELFFREFVPQGHSARLLLGDISSFTATNFHSWVSIFMIALMMEDPTSRHLDVPFLITVQGYPIEVVLSQILRLHLYTVVFADARVDGSDKHFFVPGGYLGVNGNITLTSLAFSLVMELLRISAEKSNLRLITRIGGDDFACILIGQPVMLDAFEFEIFNTISRHVGRLKDPVSLPMTSWRNGWNATQQSYCKKPVVVWRSDQPRGGTVLRVNTVRGLPVMEQLLVNPQENLTDCEVNIRFSEYFAAVRSQCRYLDQSHWLETVMVKLYLQTNPLPARICSVPIGSNYYLNAPFIEREGLLFSAQALLAVESISQVYDSNGRAYRTDLRSQLTYALTRKRVKILNVWSSCHYSDENPYHRAVVLNREAVDPRVIRRTYRYWTPLLMEPNSLVSQLEQTLVDIRAIL